MRLCLVVGLDLVTPFYFDCRRLPVTDAAGHFFVCTARAGPFDNGLDRIEIAASIDLVRIGDGTMRGLVDAAIGRNYAPVSRAKV